MDACTTAGLETGATFRQLQNHAALVLVKNPEISSPPSASSAISSAVRGLADSSTFGLSLLFFTFTPKAYILKVLAAAPFPQAAIGKP